MQPGLHRSSHPRLVVDEGGDDRTVAWVLPPGVPVPVPGTVVRLHASRITRAVRSVAAVPATALGPARTAVPA
ncbi:hypothetical protein [Kitasatospora sp. NPDC059571]|uniref:hypothetical protein n=1 Tax=Kitasatospora sp. NPDC059571 TaxID=3346871 RepID=UPI0036A74C74